MVPNIQYWEQKLFKSVLKLDRGSSPRPIVNFMTDADDGVNWIKIGDTKKGKLYINSTKEKITQEGAKKSRKVSKGEIIVSNSMSYGQPYILNIDGYIHDGWFVIRNYEKHFDKNYLLQLLVSELIQRQYKRLAAGGVVSNISSELVYAVKTIIPPLPEQRKIAQILSTWDRGIATTEKLIDASKQQKKALMQQLLTGKKRLVDHETGKAFEGEWEDTTFQSSGIKVTDGDRGKEYPKSNEFHSSEYCLFLSAQNVTKNGFKFETTQFIDEIKHNRLRKGIVNLGDLVLTTRGSVGHFAFFDKSVPYRIIRINSGMVTLTPNNLAVDSNFFYCLCRSNIIQHQIDIAAFGSAQPQLTVGIINKLKFKLPLLVEQQKIASVLTAAYKEIELLEAKLAYFKQEKKALMQQLLTGKRRVKVEKLL